MSSMSGNGGNRGGNCGVGSREQEEGYGSICPISEDQRGWIKEGDSVNGWAWTSLREGGEVQVVGEWIYFFEVRIYGSRVVQRTSLSPTKKHGNHHRIPK